MNDQYDGQGGSYVIDETGVRKLIQRTRNLGEAPPEPPVLTNVTTTEPADAGFSLPVAPAETTTTTE